LGINVWLVIFSLHFWNCLSANLRLIFRFCAVSRQVTIFFNETFNLGSYFIIRIDISSPNVRGHSAVNFKNYLHEIFSDTLLRELYSLFFLEY